MINFLNTKFTKNFAWKYWNIPKDVEIFELKKTAVRYWKDKEKGIAISREYQKALWDVPMSFWEFLKFNFIVLLGGFNDYLECGSTDTASTNNKDSWILIEGPDDNHGSDTYFRVHRRNTGPDSRSRSLIHFTLSSGSGTISAIKLYLNAETIYAGGVSDAGLYQLTQTGWTEAGVTWNKYDGTNNWASAGGDFSATLIHQTSVTTTGAKNWDLIEPNANGTGLTLTWGSEVQLLIKAVSETSTNNDAVDFSSKENGTPGNRPYIEITYTPASSIKTINGLVKSSVSTFDGLSMSSVKSINGLQ